MVLAGRNHPRYHTENYFDDEQDAPPTPPELKRTTTPLSLSKEQNELQKDLKFNQQRYRSELVCHVNAGSIHMVLVIRYIAFLVPGKLKQISSTNENQEN